MAPKTLISQHFFNDLLVCYMNSIQPRELFPKETCITPHRETLFFSSPLLAITLFTCHPFSLPQSSSSSCARPLAWRQPLVCDGIWGTTGNKTDTIHVLEGSPCSILYQLESIWMIKEYCPLYSHIQCKFLKKKKNYRKIPAKIILKYSV